MWSLVQLFNTPTTNRRSPPSTATVSQQLRHRQLAGTVYNDLDAGGVPRPRRSQQRLSSAGCTGLIRRRHHRQRRSTQRSHRRLHQRRPSHPSTRQQSATLAARTGALQLRHFLKRSPTTISATTTSISGFTGRPVYIRQTGRLQHAEVTSATNPVIDYRRRSASTTASAAAPSPTAASYVQDPRNLKLEATATLASSAFAQRHQRDPDRGHASPIRQSRQPDHHGRCRNTVRSRITLLSPQQQRLQLLQLFQPIPDQRGTVVHRTFNIPDASGNVSLQGIQAGGFFFDSTNNTITAEGSSSDVDLLNEYSSDQPNNADTLAREAKQPLPDVAPQTSSSSTRRTPTPAPSTSTPPAASRCSVRSRIRPTSRCSSRSSTPRCR